jgi:hypothetical protein
VFQKLLLEPQLFLPTKLLYSHLGQKLLLYKSGFRPDRARRYIRNAKNPAQNLAARIL